MNMQTQVKLPFITLALLLSFASANALLFTPALPSITHFFNISESAGQQIIGWFLIGYALGQLIYGPIANRYGNKFALCSGILLQIFSNLLCLLAIKFNQYDWLIIARFLMALGSGVGLKMTFTLVNEYYPPKLASQKIAYLMIAFAIIPGIAIALGGTLTHRYGWISCVYVSGCYGILLLVLVTRLSLTKTICDPQALKIQSLIRGYGEQFKNKNLLIGGLLMGSSNCFLYLFGAIAPFVGIKVLGMNSSTYGMANFLPALGLVVGGLLSARLTKYYSFIILVKMGITMMIIGTLLMFLAAELKLSVWILLFLPTMFIYFGNCFILSNASAIALAEVNNKAQGAAVMSFINMGLATIIVLGTSLLSIKILLLPTLYLILCILMLNIVSIYQAK